MKEIKYGDVFMIDLSPAIGSEQGGYRPCVIIQNNLGNRFSPTVKVAAITSKISKAKMPTHVEVKAHQVGLEQDSIIMMEQTRTIDKQRLSKWVAHLDENVMEQVDWALNLSCASDKKFKMMMNERGSKMYNKVAVV